MTELLSDERSAEAAKVLEAMESATRAASFGEVDLKYSDFETCGGMVHSKQKLHHCP